MIGITISIKDTDDVFWEQEITVGEGRFKEEITIEALYQLFKERMETEEQGVVDDEEEYTRKIGKDAEPEGAVSAEPWLRY